ncbi:MAG: RNA-guided endonuclease IscB [Chloroflexota bacterium]|nr:RNA-guided endonuclease IscB [Chloroflexota bacterium]
MKRRSEDPTNQNTVPVLDVDGSPLMPTRPSRARRLMRQGRAEKHWRKGVFTIRMTDVSAHDDDTVVDGVELNIDPGADVTGIAVVSETPDGRRAHALIELCHRGSRIRNRIDKRRSMRRGRRSRLRNRPPRFNNRTRPDGWLAPSMVTRLANTETWVKRLCALFPVKFVRVETARFDTQLMEEQEISGRQYQQGELSGWQLRSYAFHRDGARCAYCGNARAGRYELDHIVPRSRGGTDRVSNLVVSCHDCNIAKGNASVEEFLSGRPAMLAAIRAIRRSSLAGASQMNIIVPELLRRLEAMGLPTAEYDAYTTSWNRKNLRVPKTHVNDALCVGRIDRLAYLPLTKTVVRSIGHGDRQMLRPSDRHGNPRGRGYRSYCALPRQQQGYTGCPGHRSRNKQVRGIASGDIVQFHHRRHGLLKGYAVLDKARGRVAVTHEGKPVSVKAEDAVLLARNNGYRIAVEANN